MPVVVTLRDKGRTSRPNGRERVAATPSPDGGTGAGGRVDSADRLGHRETVFRAYHRNVVSFAIWSGHGRDPEVAYLDARLLAISTSELGEMGLQLHGSGVSYNILGGARPGTVDAAALHRMVHATATGDGEPAFRLEVRCEDPLGPDGLCDTARREPRPGTPVDPAGSFVIADGFAVQWVTWEDAPRDGDLRRAVYMDERFLLEAGRGPDGTVRAWPARGLMPHGFELVTPAASELMTIEDRITRVTRAARQSDGRRSGSRGG